LNKFGIFASNDGKLEQPTNSLLPQFSTTQSAFNYRESSHKGTYFTVIKTDIYYLIHSTFTNNYHKRFVIVISRFCVGCDAETSLYCSNAYVSTGKLMSAGMILG